MIRGETSHYDYVCGEARARHPGRAAADRRAVLVRRADGRQPRPGAGPLGRRQARLRARHAAEAVLALLKIKAAAAAAARPQADPRRHGARRGGTLARVTLEVVAIVADARRPRPGRDRPRLGDPARRREDRLARHAVAARRRRRRRARLRAAARPDDGRRRRHAAPPPLPDAAPSPVRLREPGRIADGYPRPARRPAHAPERDRAVPRRARPLSRRARSRPRRRRRSACRRGRRRSRSIVPAAACWATIAGVVHAAAARARPARGRARLDAAVRLALGHEPLDDPDGVGEVGGQRVEEPRLVAEDEGVGGGVARRAASAARARPRTRSSHRRRGRSARDRLQPLARSGACAWRSSASADRLLGRVVAVERGLADAGALRDVARRAWRRSPARRSRPARRRGSRPRGWGAARAGSVSVVAQPRRRTPGRGWAGRRSGARRACARIVVHRRAGDGVLRADAVDVEVEQLGLVVGVSPPISTWWSPWTTITARWPRRVARARDRDDAAVGGQRACWRRRRRTPGRRARCGSGAKPGGSGWRAIARAERARRADRAIAISSARASTRASGTWGRPPTWSPWMWVSTDARRRRRARGPRRCSAWSSSSSRVTWNSANWLVAGAPCASPASTRSRPSGCSISQAWMEELRPHRPFAQDLGAAVGARPLPAGASCRGCGRGRW